MDHMRISGTEPLSVILSQSNLKSDAQKCLNELKQKGRCNKPGNTDTENFDALKTLRILKPKSTVELGYMCPRGLSGPSAVTSSWNIETSTKMYTPF